MSLFFRKWWSNTTKLISDLHFFCDPWGYLHFFWHIFSLEWFLSPRLGSYTVLLPQCSMGWDNHKGLPMFTGRRHRSHNSMRGASRWHCKKTTWDKRYWRWSSLQNTICHSLFSGHKNSHCFCRQNMSTPASRFPKFHLIIAFAQSSVFCHLNSVWSSHEHFLKYINFSTVPLDLKTCKIKEINYLFFSCLTPKHKSLAY